jgi:hypothetical protein
MTYDLCPQHQTISTAPRGHLRLLVVRARAWAAVLTAAQAAAVHGNPAAVVHGHNLRVEAIQHLPTQVCSPRIGRRIAGRCMRRVEVCHRIHQHRAHLHHNARQGGHRIFGSE